MASAFSLREVRRGYAWLGHAQHGVTEVCALHPLYRAGDRSWNRCHASWPVTAYISSEEGLLDFVRAYVGERMVCYGLNPRPAVLTRENGRLRSAREADIAVSQNLVLDIDLEGAVTPRRLSALRAFLGVADAYFLSLGIGRPCRASTGRGSHLLFAYAPILVAAWPDVRERLRHFKEEFVVSVRQDLSRLEARVDATQDLRRMVRVYGTSKPGVGVVSRFYGRERVEDARLREYLLGLDVPTRAPVAAVSVVPGAVLPVWFAALLSLDARCRSLWEGRGKPSGSDCSVSGYDFILVQYLARQGYRHPDELGTILSLRPMGSAERGAKGSGYLSRTVGRVLGIGGANA